MKGFERKDLQLSLCGLNCALCPMQADGHCPGCGGGAGNASCSIARCSLEHGKVEYCFQYEAFPCERYKADDAWDSFVLHRNRKQDMEKARRAPGAYHSQLKAKQEILRELLDKYNDGRHKSFFCTAVNLLELERLQRVMGQLEKGEAAPAKELAARAKEWMQGEARQQGVELRLRKKTASKE